MPIARLLTGNDIAATAAFGARKLIPGTEPGGSQAGKSKPALLIRDFYVRVGAFHGSSDRSTAGIFLALSTEQDMSPSQLLELCTISASETDTTLERPHLTIHDSPLHRGTLWAPAFVGGYFAILEGTITATLAIFLDYEVVMVPWMDWFIMWEWLDGMTANSEEY